MPRPLAFFLIALAAVPLGCGRSGGAAAADASAGDAGPGAATEATAAGAAPGDAVPGGAGPAGASAADQPLLGVTSFVATVYKEPRDTAKKLGYLRVGAKVPRSAQPMGFDGCPGGWYGIQPRGFVCAGKDATLDLGDPILQAASRRPELTAPLPYRYGFVRAVLPLYVRVPTADEQIKSEFKLKAHLDWYKENEGVVNQVRFGANDVPVDGRGVPIAGKRIGELGLGKNSLEQPLGVLLGGDTHADPIPFWLRDGKRAIPNVSDFAVPDYAVFADRARRFTGLAFVGSFPTGPESLGRRFSVTTDLRLAPTTKVKPDTGSPWHGVELSDDVTLPLAFVRAPGARAYKVVKGRATPAGEVDFRSVHPLVAKMRTVEGVRYYRTKDHRWLSHHDVGLAVAPAVWPEAAQKGEKWIEISIGNQTLVLWEGKRPVYATLVSTGKAGIDDPKTTTATLRGVFRIRNKHVTATMDSNESSAVGGAADTTAFASAVSQAPARDDDDDPPPKPRASSPAPPKAKSASKDTRGASGEKGGKGTKDAKEASSKAAANPAKAASAGKGAAKGQKTSKASPPPPKTADAKRGTKSGKAGSVKDPKAAATAGTSEKGGAAKKRGGAEPPSIEEGYVPRKGDGLYGVTRRRGEGKYMLRDVPYIQYFAQGYALHVAYWHDVFGTPRSHGCVNLSPIDGHRVFLWTDPPIPDGWHALNTGEEPGEGTVVIVHE